MNKNISLLDEKLLDMSLQDADMPNLNENQRMMIKVPG
jgi:hypothetical protein